MVTIDVELPSMERSNRVSHVAFPLCHAMYTNALNHPPRGVQDSSSSSGKGEGRAKESFALKVHSKSNDYTFKST